VTKLNRDIRIHEQWFEKRIPNYWNLKMYRPGPKERDQGLSFGPDNIFTGRYRRFKDDI